MTRYLVTGGAGFIGSHVAEALVVRGHAVRVVDDLSTGRRQNIDGLGVVEFLEADLSEPGVAARAVAGMDYVVHLASIPSVPRSVRDPAAATARTWRRPISSFLRRVTRTSRGSSSRARRLSTATRPACPRARRCHRLPLLKLMSVTRLMLQGRGQQVRGMDDAVALR